MCHFEDSFCCSKRNSFMQAVESIYFVQLAEAVKKSTAIRIKQPFR